jgi:hypothetical protein
MNVVEKVFVIIILILQLVFPIAVDAVNSTANQTQNLPISPMLTLSPNSSDTAANRSTFSNVINATAKLENATNATNNAVIALKNASSSLANATKDFLKNNSNIAVKPSPKNVSAINTTRVVDSIFGSSLPIIFIAVIALAMVVPLVIDMVMSYIKKPKQSLDKENTAAVGMRGLYRTLMTFGVILLVGTIVFYILALTTLNINTPTNPVLQSLIDILKSLATILGTALATIIAFYFGIRGSESATEKALAATKPTTAKTPPTILVTSPADGATGVPVASLVTATFSEPMSSSTINKNTFTVKKDGTTNNIDGIVTLGPDGKTAVFDATPDFSPNTKYVATIDIGAKDMEGNVLSSPKLWSFKTANEEHTETK